MACGCRITETPLTTETPDFFVPYLGGVTANVLALGFLLFVIGFIILLRYLCTRPANSCVGRYIFFWDRIERGVEPDVPIDEPELECLFPDPPPLYRHTI